ncbi:AAA family ATPase [Pedobacter antarcticus]|uniref:AAA family ATPase n=1 Tax=Pedobacter antarcticus TaxID=34086 RepID=UPI000884173A|nr:AAA family ATPase [Pedobacter antarcticus]SDM41059.1 AAA domain-containing protein, putative AbiEii toxin, Type IV TA system [Pedobacter antarcticus]
MILRTVDNGKAIKSAKSIELPDLTILTGENGSGKTQLLSWMYNHMYEFREYFQFDNDDETTFPCLTDDNGNALKNIYYAKPGMRSEQNTPLYQDFDTLSIFKNIQAEWAPLNLIIKCYIDLTGIEIEFASEEANLINQTIESLFKTITKGQLAYENTIIVDTGQIRIVKDLAVKCNKEIQKLTFIDFLTFYEFSSSFFSTSLLLLFHQFCLKRTYYPHLTVDVRAPWDVFNDISTNAGFGYKIEYSPSDSYNKLGSIQLIRLDNSNVKVPFEGLSSGETSILALIFAVYSSSTGGKFPDVLLLDEADAFLHPSFAKVFIDILLNIQSSSKNALKIIMTTHSPSTVALAPAESIFIMEKGVGYPVKANQQTAVHNLSNGMATMTLQEGHLSISHNIERSEKHILFTEGITDKIILEIAWSKLYEEKEMDFFIQDSFDAGFLGNLFQRGADKPDGIFIQYDEKIMIALFDFDEKGYNEWNKTGGGKNPNFTANLELDPRKCFTRKSLLCDNAYKILLPVPYNDVVASQVILDEYKTYQNKSCLTIELLFYGIEELSDFFVSSPAVKTTIVAIKENKKREFTEAIRLLPKEKFIAFLPLFEKIEALLKL